MEVYVFPKSFRQSAGDFNETYPSICFSHKDRNNQPQFNVYLPMPPGLEISDSMTYDTIELGQIGDMASKLIAAANEEGFDAKKLGKQLKDEVKSKFANMNKAAAASIALKAVPIPGIDAAGIVDFSTKQLIAKNANTRFQGANMRSFNFRFKMVADTQSESDSIKNIVDAFREAAYPGGNTVIQEYPGTWNIGFLDGLTDNPYLPQIYDCYLTSFSSVYNSSTNIWHQDGAPIEVDIALSFTETRTLNRRDIEKLNGKYVPEEMQNDSTPVAAAAIEAESRTAQRNTSNVGIGGIPNAFGLGGRGPFGG